MSYCVMVEMYCDKPGCNEGVEAHWSKSAARKEAVKLGWQVGRGHFCPKHRRKGRSSREHP